MRFNRVLTGLQLCTALLFEIGLLSSAFAQPPASTPQFSGTLPLAFEQNRGQAPEQVEYLAHTSDGVMQFSREKLEIPCASGKSGVVLHIAGASVPTLRAESATGGRVNYYPDSDRAKWIEGVPLERNLRYEHIAPGVDLVFHGRDGRLEYDLEIAAGADFSSVGFEPEAGATFAVKTDGSVEFRAQAASKCGAEAIHLLAPIAFQEIDGQRHKVRAAFSLDDNGRLTFTAPHYDHRRPLTIDPVVAYTKLIGVDNATTVNGMQVDSAGDVFITGSTYGVNYPVVNGSGSSASGSTQIYLTELDPTGTQILYSTYFPGGGFGSSSALALDSAGNVYIVGVTTTSNFPTTSHNLGVCSTFCNTGFAAKFNSSGTLAYSTMLGTGQQLPKAALVDSSGNLYVAGLTVDAGLQTVNAYQSQYAAQICTSCGGPFFGKLNATGTAWLFSSNFSSPGYTTFETFATGMALDTNGNLYIAGVGTAVPLRNQLQTGTGDGFVAEFGPDGKSLIFSTLLGGSAGGTNGSLFGVQVGSDATIYVAGTSSSPDYPYTPVAFQHPIFPGTYGYGLDLFATAINPAHTGFTYSTYLGQGFLNTTAFDSHGNLYIAGSGNATILPLKNSVATDVTNSGFVLEVDPTGALVNGTALGGHNVTQIPTALAVDGSGAIYVAGTPGGSTSAVPNVGDAINVGTGSAYAQQSGTSPYSAFIAKIAPANHPQISLSYYEPVLELRNAGSADLHISSIQVDGGNPNSTCGSTVPAGSSCFLTPTDSTAHSTTGAVTINSDAQPATQSFVPGAAPTGPIPGKPPVGGILYYDFTQLTFPPTQNGTTSAPRALNIWNVGAANVMINNILTFGFFQQTNNCGTLAPQTYCTAQITVSPLSSGSPQPNIGIVHDGTVRDNLFVSFRQNPSDGPLLLSTSSVNFGSQLLNQQSVIHTITVTNTGTSAVSVSAPALGGTNTASFSVAGNTCSGISLQPQASCIVSVAFQPAVGGLLFAPLTLSTSGVTSTVTLSGTGMVPPTVSISPTSYNFNDVFLGQSAQQVFTIQNNGTISTTVSNIVAAMADETPATDYAEQDTCQNALAAGASCTATVTFSPQVSGSRNGILSLAINGGITTMTASLNANGVFPITPSSTSFAFGQVPVGTVGSPQTLTLTNQSAATQSVTASVAAPFQIASNNCGTTLAAGAQCTLSLAFAPQASGAQTLAVTVVVAGVSQQLSIAVSGAGTVPIASLSTTSLGFGDQAVGLSSNPQTLTLSNSGNAPLDGITLSVNGANAADFTASGNCGSTLAAGASCSMGVVFKPSGTGAESATLNLADNAAGSPQAVQLAGRGVPPDFSPAAAVASSTVAAGQTASYNISFPSTMSGTVSLSCSNLPFYAACSFNPPTVTLSTTTASNTTLTITTSTTTTAALFRHGWSGIGTAALLFFCAPLLRRRRFTGALLTIVALAILIGGVTGCSGSSSGGNGGSTTQHTVAPGRYVVNVVATSGTVSHSLALTLNVQ